MKNIKLEDKTEDIIHLNKKGKVSEKEKVVKGALLKNKIIVTDLGKIVLEYLQKQFSDIIHQDFTVQVEKDLDLISQGKYIWQDVVKKVYDSFIGIVKEQIKNKTTNKSKNILIGKIKSNEIYKGEGKYEPYILCNKKFINIKNYLKKHNKNLEDIDLEDCKTVIQSLRQS